jgi:hypothetical protein
MTFLLRLRYVALRTLMCFAALGMMVPMQVQAQGSFTSDYEWESPMWQYARFFESSLGDSTKSHPWQRRVSGQLGAASGCRL